MSSIEVNATSGKVLDGLWRSFYRYPSSGRDGDEFWGQHVVQATYTGDAVRLESVPGSKSHLLLELQLDPGGRTATGTWREETEQDGYYKGAVYEGTIDLEVSADGQRMSGTWHGKGTDGAVNSDVWEFTKNGIAQPGEVAQDELESTTNNE